jgi:hypothetical protein
MERICPLNDTQYAATTTTYTGTAGTLAGWPAGPRGVYVVCTTAAYVRVGEGVTATTADLYVPASVPVVIDVPRGTKSTWTVSAIQVAAAGSVYAKPVQA